MSEVYILDMCRDIQPLISNSSIKEEDQGAILSGTIEAGVKGIDVNITITPGSVKIKANREYKYPIDEASADRFHEEVHSKYIKFGAFVSGQVLSISRFFALETVEEATNEIRDAVEVIRQIVILFEDSCVNFMEKMNGDKKEEDEYNPEANVDLVNVDNSFHAVVTTERDNSSYTASHIEFTDATFSKLAESIGAVRDLNEILKTDEASGRTLKCVLFREDAEILLSVSVPASRDVGAMYVSFINSNYPELMCGYDDNKETFTIRTYSTPDEYEPEMTEELLRTCQTAMDACISEFEANLHKKDSADFASDMQKILAEQTDEVAAREKAVAERENEMLKREEEMLTREQELKNKVAELEAEKEHIGQLMKQNEEKMKQKEAEMKEKIRVYEERNTKDILNIQQLANKVAALQNRQNALGQVDDQSEEEIFRLKSKVQQLTSQKIALEKKLTEKINNKDAKIKQLSETINLKDRENKKMEIAMKDMVQSKVSEEVKKTEGYIKELEEKVNAIGHILTPEDMIEYYGEDAEIKKHHAQNGNVLVYEDEALEIRIRFGDVNFVEVSREATLKDQLLRKLNTKFADIKFSSKDSRIIARGYFSKTATADDVDELVEKISENFAK